MHIQLQGKRREDSGSRSVGDQGLPVVTSRLQEGFKPPVSNYKFSFLTVKIQREFYLSDHVLNFHDLPN